MSESIVYLSPHYKH